MYKEYWSLTRKPFENTPDPRFIYYSPQHEEVFSRLLYVIKEGKGAAMLTGVFGCGKTLMSRILLKELDSSIYKIVLITNPYLTYEELLMHICYNLGCKDLPDRKSEVLVNVILQRLNEALVNNMRDGKKTVVIIDEAHLIKDRKVWEGIRLILNFQLDDKFLITLLLLGQPELEEAMDINKQFSQRIAIKGHLGSFDDDDAKKYIQHRLSVAGRDKDLFTEDAYKEIFKKSGGIPRRINNICDLALLSGFGLKTSLIDKDIIKDVANDLGN